MVVPGRPYFFPPRLALSLLLCLIGAGYATSQNPPPDDSLENVRAQMQELRKALEQMRGDLAASKSETEGLRREVESLREQLRQVQAANGAVQPQTTVADLANEQRLTAAKVDEQSQTKVASGSNYHVRLSGMALITGFGVRGAVDNLDVPKTARPLANGEPKGSTGATVRQSLIGIEVFGPQWAGARASGEVNVDFFGGFPASSEGLTAGLLRLRTARINLDWKNTSITAGQDAPFVSPRSPSSLVASAYPPLSGAGNLWTWTPQIYIERRLEHFSIQGGVLDPLTGELPATEYERSATAGEHSRTPAYAARIGWQSSTEGAALLGAGGYYSLQDWGFHRTVDAWAITSDWEFPLGAKFTFSGEFYRGRAIGGLGGGATGSVIFAGAAILPSSAVVAVDSAGGWSQLKFRPSDILQFNAAFGKDATLGSAFDRFPLAVGLVRRNASGFANVIFQPRSNLLFSLEYRRLWTSRFGQPLAVADHIGLGAGILF